MQPLYPYFAIYRGPKQTEEFIKYIYSHAQALKEVQDLNDKIKEDVTITAKDVIDSINESSSRANNIEHHLKTYSERGRTR